MHDSRHHHEHVPCPPVRQPRFATNTARARAREVLRSQNAADAPACPRRRQRTAHACARVLLHRPPAHHGQACGCACTRRTPRQHCAQHRRHTKGAVTDLLLPADVRACMVALAHSQCARQVVRTASTGWACRTSAIMVHRANEWVCGFEVGLGVLTNTAGVVCTPALPLEHSVQGGGGGGGAEEGGGTTPSVPPMRRAGEPKSTGKGGCFFRALPT